MMSSVLLFFLIAVATSAPSSWQPDGKIVGGRTIDITEVPWQVSLRYSNSHICGGSIVTPKFVITAAHCTHETTETDLSVRAGSTYFPVGGQVKNVTKIKEHPLYNQYLMLNDISILELDKNFIFNSAVQAISLPATGYDLPVATLVLVTGWGLTSEGGTVSVSLQGVDVPIVSLLGCKAAYGSQLIRNTMICAGFSQGDRDACQGDSGGPLSYDGTLIGIVSWGVGCARPGYPGVYTRVSEFIPFIKSIVT